MLSAGALTNYENALHLVTVLQVRDRCQPPHLRISPSGRPSRSVGKPRTGVPDPSVGQCVTMTDSLLGHGSGWVLSHLQIRMLIEPTPAGVFSVTVIGPSVL
jgi:hypothetical protein